MGPALPSQVSTVFKSYVLHTEDEDCARHIFLEISDYEQNDYFKHLEHLVNENQKINV